jgi:hypothetical protein
MYVILRERSEMNYQNILLIFIITFSGYLNCSFGRSLKTPPDPFCCTSILNPQAILWELFVSGLVFRRTSPLQHNPSDHR